MINDFFAKEILGESYTDEKGAFIAEILQSAREGNLCYSAKGPDLPESIVAKGQMYPKAPLVRENDRYYLQKNWVIEKLLVKELKRLNSRKTAISFDAIENEKHLTEDQKKAARHYFNNSFSILCGGPGAGKTHTMAYFLRAFLKTIEDPNYKIVLASPTGKAALHLQASVFSKVGLHFDAMTIHRLLNLRPKETNFFLRQRIDAHLVIVDEASMMDAAMLAHLLASIGDNTRLILMGDPNQLPPVDGPGVFAEISDLYGVYLNQCMRTEDQLLNLSAAAILASDETAFFSSVKFSEIGEDLVDTLYEKIGPMISPETIDPVSFFEESKKLKILDMLRSGPLGLERLNQKILEKLSRDLPDGFFFAIPIMVTANLPNHHLYNGSTGVLIGQKRGHLNLSIGTAYFENGGEFTNPPPYEVSFVLSIHKSQGSEFDEVIALFPPGSERFGKEALYTAATRAKKKWEIIGDREAIYKILAKKGSAVSGIKSQMNSTDFI